MVSNGLGTKTDILDCFYCDFSPQNLAPGPGDLAPGPGSLFGMLEASEHSARVPNRFAITCVPFLDSF